MSGNFVIEVNDASVEYYVQQRKGLISRAVVKRVRALDRINVKIEKGEIVGLFGKNGAGKTTLLQLIGGVLRPCEGEVKTVGRVYKLRGANPGLINSMTPRENVRLLASAYGINEEDVGDFENEIEEFCDLGEAFDRKMSTLSSGMAGRVGFGFTTSLRPEILLMDETLGVGDKDFRKKAEEKAKLFMERGETILLSTHSLNLAKDMCSRGLVLKEGSLVFDGPVGEAVDRYLGM